MNIYYPAPSAALDGRQSPAIVLSHGGGNSGGDNSQYCFIGTVSHIILIRLASPQLRCRCVGCTRTYVHTYIPIYHPIHASQLMSVLRYRKIKQKQHPQQLATQLLQSVAFPLTTTFYAAFCWLLDVVANGCLPAALGTTWNNEPPR